MQTFWNWVCGILVTALLITVPVFCYWKGHEHGKKEGRELERHLWMDDAGNQPYVHQTHTGSFYYVRKWHGKKPLPEIPWLE